MIYIGVHHHRYSERIEFDDSADFLGQKPSMQSGEQIERQNGTYSVHGENRGMRNVKASTYVYEGNVGNRNKTPTPSSTAFVILFR